MRNHSFVAGNYYHIYIHSVGDMPLFRSEGDYKRFLLTMFLANGTASIPRIDRYTDLNSVRDISKEIGSPLVKIVNFCLMPTHFHTTLGENSDGNISRYMHKILVSFAKYTNKKYERRGHVFESEFHSKHLDTNEYLLRASGYIHLNPQKLHEWQTREESYPWSSYQDYIARNRWDSLIRPDVVISQFDGGDNYKRFVEETRAEIFDGSSFLT